MNKPARFFVLAVFAAMAGVAWAQEEVELKVVANNEDGVAVGEAPVTLESKLRFSKSEVNLYTGEILTSAFRYADMKSLSFRYDKFTGMKSVKADTPLRLRNNPVGEFLELLGTSGECRPLSVSDLRGGVRIYLPEWNGEPVDVADLAPGLYFVTVNKTTFKFIKK